MNFSFKKSTKRTFPLLVVLLSAWNSFAAEAAYKIEILPPVQTPLGKFDTFLGREDMNDVGQVVGDVRVQFATGGFLYTPGQGMKFIDPSGLHNVDIWQINNKGLVVGRDLADPRYAIFSYDPQKGYESLRKNLTSSDMRSFGLRDMNDSGTILANGAGKYRGRVVSVPWRYTSAAGRWEILTSTNSALKKFHGKNFNSLQINENGDFTFVRGEMDGIHIYVYYAKSDTIVDLSQFNRDLGNSRDMVPLATDLNDFGWVTLTKYIFTILPVVKPVSGQPYLFVPRGGIRILRPPIKSPTIATLNIAADGTVGGCVEKQGYCFSLFTYIQNAGYKFVSEERFRSMLPSDMRFTGLDMRPMNDRKEFIGSIDAVENGGSEVRPRVWFLSSPQGGLRDLQKIVDQVQPNLKIVRVNQINNRGQILMRVESGSNESLAILSPSN